jgi:MFS family permease
MSWETFLRFVSGAGVSTGVAVVLSILVEYVPRYSYLSPKQKRLIYAALCLVMPVTGAALLAAGGYEPLTWDPLVWRAVLAGAAAFGAGTAAHTPRLHKQSEILVGNIQER